MIRLLLISCLILYTQGHPKFRRIRRDDDVAGITYAPCKDTYTQCPEWKKSGMCDMPQYKDYMPLVCTDTCGYCKEAKQDGLGLADSSSALAAISSPSIAAAFVNPSIPSAIEVSNSVEPSTPDVAPKDVTPSSDVKATSDDTVQNEYQEQLRKYYANIEEQQKAYAASIQQYTQTESAPAAASPAETGSSNAVAPTYDVPATPSNTVASPYDTSAAAAPVAAPIAAPEVPQIAAATGDTPAAQPASSETGSANTATPYADPAAAAAVDPAAAAAAAAYNPPYNTQPYNPPYSNYPAPDNSSSSSSSSSSAGSSSSSSSSSDSSSSTSISVGSPQSPLNSNDTSSNSSSSNPEVAQAVPAPSLPSKVAPETPSMPALPPLLVLPPISESLLVDDSNKANASAAPAVEKEISDKQKAAALQGAADSKPYPIEKIPDAKVEGATKEATKTEDITKEVTKETPEEATKEETSSAITEDKSKKLKYQKKESDRKIITEDQSTNEMKNSESKHLAVEDTSNEEEEDEHKMIKSFTSDQGKPQVNKGAALKRKRLDSDLKDAREITASKTQAAIQQQQQTAQVQPKQSAHQKADSLSEKQQPAEKQLFQQKEPAKQIVKSAPKREKKKTPENENEVFKHDEKSVSVSGSGAGGSDENFEDLNYITDFNPDDFDMDVPDISRKILLHPNEKRDSVPKYPKEHPLYAHFHSHLNRDHSAGIQKARSAITAPMIIDAVETGEPVSLMDSLASERSKIHTKSVAPKAESKEEEAAAESGNEEGDAPDDEESGEVAEEAKVIEKVVAAKEDEKKNTGEKKSATAKTEDKKTVKASSDKQTKEVSNKKSKVKTEEKKIAKTIVVKEMVNKKVEAAPATASKTKKAEKKSKSAKKVTKILTARKEVPKKKEQVATAVKRTNTEHMITTTLADLSGAGSGETDTDNLLTSGDSPYRSTIEGSTNAADAEDEDEDGEGDDDDDSTKKSENAHQRQNFQLNGDPEMVDLKPKKNTPQPDLNDFPDKIDKSNYSEEDEEDESTPADTGKSSDAGEGELDDLKIEELLKDDTSKGKKKKEKKKEKKVEAAKTEKAQEKLVEGMNLLTECEGILSKIGKCIDAKKDPAKVDATQYASTNGKHASYAPVEQKAAPSPVQQPTLTSEEVDKDKNEEEDIDTEPVKEKTPEVQKASKEKEVIGKISLVLSQNFNTLYEKTDSPSYQMLAGNVKKDLEKMVKGTVKDITFSEVSVEGNPRQSGKTKVSFNMNASGNEWMKKLLKLVDSGDIDGLKVIKGSLEIEEE